MIFIDSNVPMYLVGADHPHKTESRILLERFVASGERLVTDVEVMQEILHRYTAINRRDAIGPAMRLLLATVDQVFPLEEEDVLRAKRLLDSPENFSARDAIHLAVMERYGVRKIVSFDADFDRKAGVTRIFSV